MFILNSWLNAKKENKVEVKSQKIDWLTPFHSYKFLIGPKKNLLANKKFVSSVLAAEKKIVSYLKEATITNLT